VVVGRRRWAEHRAIDRSFTPGAPRARLGRGPEPCHRGALGRGQFDRLLKLADELIQLPVDLLVTGNPPATKAAKQATTTLPIVMTFSGDPVGTGFVASLAHPDGNITGLATLSPTLSTKRLSLLTEAIPRLSRVAVLWNAADPEKATDLTATRDAARQLGVQIQSLEVRGPEQFAAAFDAAVSGQAEALIALHDPLIHVNRTQVVELAARHRLPTIYDLREYVADGGLMAYGPNLISLHRQAAYFVDRILKGAKPRDLPVEQPTTFEFVINLQTARALGLTISESVLQQATEIIQ
jgi:putative ABC transport system substrate-binding protein